MHRKPFWPGANRLLVRFTALALFVVAVGSVSVRAQDSADVGWLRVLALGLVNKSRAEHKLPPLQIGQEINEAAKFHAADMARRNYYGHTSPEGKSVGDRYQKAGGGYGRMTAENIARCTGRNCDSVSVKTVEELHRGWMNSKAHRENILRQGITQFGFGIAAEKGGPLYAVQTFAGPGVPLAVAASGPAKAVAAKEAPKRISEAEAIKTALEILNRERKQAGRPAFLESPSLTQAARSILPPKNLDDFDLGEISKVREALPAAERDNWGKLALLAASCNGCGAEPTDTDVRTFIQRWLAKPGNKEEVLSPDAAYLGFVLAASGQGKKVALAVLGKKQPK